MQENNTQKTVYSWENYRLFSQLKKNNVFSVDVLIFDCILNCVDQTFFIWS